MSRPSITRSYRAHSLQEAANKWNEISLKTFLLKFVDGPQEKSCERGRKIAKHDTADRDFSVT